MNQPIFLLLIFSFLAISCAPDTNDLPPVKNTQTKPPLQFSHDENDTYYLLLKSDQDTYTEEVVTIGKYIEKTNSKKLRVNHLYFRDRGQVFVYIKRFSDLAEALEYKRKLETAGLFSPGREFVPVSMHNYRILLSKKMTFVAYIDFYNSSTNKTN